MLVITSAGKATAAKSDVKTSRKQLIKEVARRLRAAQTDDEAADAIEAALALAVMPDSDSDEK